MLEARHWEHVEVVEMQDIFSDRSLSASDWIPLAIHDAVEQMDHAVFYVDTAYYLRRPIAKPYDAVMTDGYVFAGSAEGKGQTGCCSTEIIGFKHNHVMFERVLVPAATCVITKECRGTWHKVMFDALADAVQERAGNIVLDSKWCLCGQGVPLNTRDSAFVMHDLSNPNGM